MSSYRNAGVDIEAGYRAVELMKAHVAKTTGSECLGGLGGFGGLFSIKAAKEMEDPILVSGTDGVGTKLKIAFLTDRHDTVGIDLVAMSVNDIICCGAKPLYFLDYIACGKNYPERIEQIVKGVAEGCQMAGVSLIGGETAEMPGFYANNEYDLAGFAVGLVDKPRVIDGGKIAEGDALIGIASSGLHSNGYSLVRHILRPSEYNIGEYVEYLGTTLGEELLKPNKIYVKPILGLIERLEVKGISNITGGGFYENIPRMFPKDGGLQARIRLGSWPVYPIFSLIEQTGGISRKDMYNTFNMGIGMVLAVGKDDAETAIAALGELGEKAYIIGEVAKGGGVGEGVCLE